MRSMIVDSASSMLLPIRSRSKLESFGHHHLHKLFIIDLAITIDIGFPNHLIYLFICKLLSQICHDMTQLCGADEAIAITVENLKGFDQFFFSVRVLHLARHQRQKLWEIDGSIAICVYFIDHVLKLCLSRVLAQRAHHSAQLFCRDGAIAVFVEQAKCLLELSDLLFSQLVCHID